MMGGRGVNILTQEGKGTVEDRTVKHGGETKHRETLTFFCRDMCTFKRGKRKKVR